MNLGHKQGHEYWHEAQEAEQERITQQEFNNRMNNPDYYQIEDPHENRSHAHEKNYEEYKAEEIPEAESEEQSM